MITEFTLLDQSYLNEKNKTMILLIVDMDELWKIDEKPGVFRLRGQRL